MIACALLSFALAAAQDPAPLRAGFAQADLTPPPGVRKIGSNRHFVGTTIHDPLYARAAVFECGEGRAAFLSLDLLFVHRDQVAEIRRRVAEKFRFPGEALMIGATHNHAGPAIEADLYPKDDASIAAMIEASVDAVGRAWEGRKEAELGFGSVAEWRLSYNRRVIYRDGTARTHGSFRDPAALAFEGPIDPEVAVVAVRAKDGTPLGLMVNFACHPCHHGGDALVSAGYPGQMSRALQEKGWPVSLFLQGAGGNLHHLDPSGANPEKSMEESGKLLAEAAVKVVAGLKYRATARISSRTRTVELPYRAFTEDELKGRTKGAQQFGEKGFYDGTAAALLEEIRREGVAKAEIQAIFIDDLVHVAIPAEYFVEHGLRIKEECFPLRTRVVGYANGMLGYVPTRGAFARGGYETTFGMRSKLAPDAGDLLADAAIALVRAK